MDYADLASLKGFRQVLIDHMIEVVGKKLQISEAEIGRRLGVDRQRLYHWKTHRRRMPTPALYQLITMAGANITNALGQYAMEWHQAKVKAGKAKRCIDRPQRVGRLVAGRDDRP